MSNIQIGDKVTWLQRTTARPYLHSETGVVTDIVAGYVWIQRGYDFDIVSFERISKVSPIEAAVDDYDLMTRLAGDLSGAEL